MASVGFYQAEAERCRKLADAAKDPEAASRWRAMARDCAALADDLDQAPPLPPTVHVPPQQQPVQQQQTTIKPKDHK